MPLRQEIDLRRHRLLARCDAVIHLGWFCIILLAATTIVASLAGCAVGDNLPGPSSAMVPMPREALCTQFEADMRPALGDLDDLVVPSITPAPAGIRIIVDIHFDPFMGSSTPVPGGRLVWNVWIYHWLDGDHLGAIGRVNNTTTCRWYDPL